MTGTIPEKAHCMKCGVLIHVQSGVAYTGRAEEDKFIGCPVVLLKENRKDLTATLAPDALLMTWREGKESRIEKVPYQAITGLDMGERTQSEVITWVSGEPLAASRWLAFGVLYLVDPAFTNVETLKIETAPREYELYVPQASDWAERLRREVGLPTPEKPLKPPF